MNPPGLIKIAEDDDFNKLKEMVDRQDDWLLEYDKQGVRVWSQQGTDEASKMIKVISHFPAVNPLDLYDVMHDPDYRKLWDHSMIESIDIGHLNPNNDVCYYAVSCPPPMKNRDFVLQRSWLDMGAEQYIINHSVLLDNFPPRLGRVRAHSLFTGYLIRQSPNKGCTLGYVTQSNLQGDLPSWLVNKGTKILAPKYVRQLEKAALGYSNWKLKNNPSFKPWHYPEQITSPKLHIQQAVLMLSPGASRVATASLNEGSPTPPIQSPKPPSSPPKRAQSLKESNESSSRKSQFLSCLNFSKHCVGRSPDENLT